MITIEKHTAEERKVIAKAYRFELEAIKNDSVESNPYFETIKNWKDGATILEVISKAVEKKEA